MILCNGIGAIMKAPEGEWEAGETTLSDERTDKRLVTPLGLNPLDMSAFISLSYEVIEACVR